MRIEERSKLIDGKGTAEAIVSEVTSAVRRFAEGRRPPHLVVVMAGDNPASQIYVRNKVSMAGRCGIRSTLVALPGDVAEEDLVGRLGALGEDDSVDGILVQLPLPSHIDQQRVIETVSPAKDVDGLHPYNLGRLAAGKPRFIPCTPAGVCELLARYGVGIAGSRVVVVGRSILVGTPLALLLSRKGERGNATVTVCHSRTEDLGSVTADADILVAAVGKAGAITGDMVKEGAVVIDVGTNRVPDPSAPKGTRLAGDVDFASVLPRASLITPVPGGVGPMTVAMLMKNALQAARWGYGIDDEG